MNNNMLFRCWSGYCKISTIPWYLQGHVKDPGVGVKAIPQNLQGCVTNFLFLYLILNIPNNILKL